MVLMLGVARGRHTESTVELPRHGKPRPETGRGSRRHCPKQSPTDDDKEQEPLMDDEITRSQESVAEGDFRLGTSSLVSNIMIDDDGRTPSLMGLGSIAPSLRVRSRSHPDTWPLPSRMAGHGGQNTARYPIGHRSCSTSTSGPSCTPVLSGKGKAPSRHGAR
ncbi:hypothetical protein Egran_06376, partial [Elaphomyces granulatus]